jgi:hypothetical protein
VTEFDSESSSGPDRGPARGPDGLAAQPRPVPRSAELDGLLRELDQLRRTLETDLSIAAAAVEEGSFEIATQVLSHDQSVLRAFGGQASHRLRTSQPPRHLPSSHRSGLRRLLVGVAGPIALTAAAAALVVTALLTAGPTAVPPGQGSAAPQTSDTLRASLTSLTQPYRALVELSDQSAPDLKVRAASARLNAGVRGASEQLRTDPIAATAALGILQAERQVLDQRDVAGTMSDLISRNQQLTQEIQATMPAGAVPAPTDPVLTVPQQPQPTEQPAPVEPQPTTQTTPAAQEPLPTTAASPAEQVQPASPSDLLGILADITQTGTAPSASPAQP